MGEAEALGYDELYGLALEVSDALADAHEENAHLLHRVNRLRMVLLSIADDDLVPAPVRNAVVVAELEDAAFRRQRLEAFVSGEDECGETKGEGIRRG